MHVLFTLEGHRTAVVGWSQEDVVDFYLSGR
jgi:hypothetical protein